MEQTFDRGINHVLVLVTLNADLTDAMGNQYPSDGFIRANQFLNDKSLLNGLHGVVWGRTPGSIYLKDDVGSRWAVIKTDQHSIVLVDETSNLVKFEKGIIVYVGDRQSCAQVILKYRLERGLQGDGVDEREIAGYFAHAALPNRIALSQGFYGKALSRVAGLPAIVTAFGGQATATETVTHALSFEANSEAVTLDDNSHAIAFGINSSARTSGSKSWAIVCGSGSQAIAIGEESVAICLAPNCVGSAGPGGMIVAMCKNANSYKIIAAQVGTHVLSNRAYTIDENGGFTLIGDKST